MAAVVKVLFVPISVITGLLAGAVAKKVFEQVWGIFDDQEPPEAEHRRIDFGKLAVALALEGAIFRLAKGFTDHGLRKGVARVTGEWPGEEEPDPE